MRFFSQNDPKWRLKRMGNSSEILGVSGCTTTCISDASSYFNDTKTPLELSNSLIYTPNGKIIWSSISRAVTKFEFEYRYYKFDQKIITTALKDPDKVVLLNVNYGKHWVFLCGADILGLGYKTNDPYPFPSVMKRYKAKEIVGFTILRKA